MSRVPRVAIAVVLAASFGATVVAQQGSSVTAFDIQRLQDNVYQAAADVTELRSRDRARAGEIQTGLEELREDSDLPQSQAAQGGFAPARRARRRPRSCRGSARARR